MTWQIAMTLLVVAASVLALVILRTGPEFVLMGGLSLLLATGVISTRDALGGFSNEGLAAVAVLYVVAEGLRLTGGLSSLTNRMLGSSTSLLRIHTRIAVPVALMSAFMNNTPVVAMMLPVLNDWAKKFRVSISSLLMPLSYAAILGGLTTLVGTSTTLVVNGLIISETSRAGLGMFEIAWVGVPAMIVGLIYIVACARWMLPERKPAITPLDDPREYTVEMLVQPGSTLVGKTIEEAGLRHLPGMYLMEIDRQGHLVVAVSSDERLQAKDRLVFVGIVESVVDLQKIPGLQPATDQTFKLDAPKTERCLIEAVVSNSCPVIRVPIRDSKFRSRYGAAIIAVARNGQRIKKKVGDIELLPGDTLLLEAASSFIDLQRNSRDFFLVSQVENSTPPRHEKAWIARLILLLMIVAVTTEYLTMLKAALLASAAMLLTGCCQGPEAKRAIDWGVLLTIGAGLGIGKAMDQSGAAVLIAESLINTLGTSPYLALAVVYGITMIFTNTITAKAAAVLIFPIAVATATRLGVEPMAFIVAVIIASAASFATPIGYQTNLMVYGPGGYRFSDYLRFGAPLSLIIWVITVVIAPVVWPFVV